jgi:hypothetical protein
MGCGMGVTLFSSVEFGVQAIVGGMPKTCKNVLSLDHQEKLHKL